MRRLAALACALISFCTAAHAAGFEVVPIGDKGAYVGCVAANSDTEVAFAAVGPQLAILLQSKLLRLRKGDEVDGTWSVDGAKERPLEEKADSPNTVSAMLNDTTMAQVMKGKAISVTVGATEVEWQLDGTQKAVLDLAACMQTNVKR